MGQMDQPQAQTAVEAAEPSSIWRAAYGQGDGRQTVAQAKETREARPEINWTPPERVNGTFTEGTHQVRDGVYIATGKAKVEASGSAIVYASGEAYVKGKDRATLYVSERASGQVDDNGTLYARGNGEAYGFNNSKVFAFDKVEVHVHDSPTVRAFDDALVFSNDNSTVYAHDHVTVWPREPVPEDQDTVHAYDSATVVTSPGTRLNPDHRPIIRLHDHAVWIDYDPRFGNPVITRASDKK